MSSELICPVCNSDDHLRGERHDHLIHITCSACEISWDRDLRPTCPSCGETDLWTTAQAVWEKSRGSQVSIVSVTPVHLCPHCDPERHRWARETNSPLPPVENPASDWK